MCDVSIGKFHNTVCEVSIDRSVQALLCLSQALSPLGSDRSCCDTGLHDIVDKAVLYCLSWVIRQEFKIYKTPRVHLMF